MSGFPDAAFLLSAAAPGQFPPDRGVEIAFAGRSNAGKSSAINAILERRALARTSKTPGQTRLINFFGIRPDARIVDLPGYGYARVAQQERAQWGPLIDGLRKRGAFRGLFLVVDVRRGVRPEDLALIEWAQPQRRRVHVLLAKADKLNRASRAAALARARAQLAGSATAQLFSALEGTGVEQAQRELALWLAELKDPGGREATGVD